jgi:hypothetical protein
MFVCAPVLSNLEAIYMMDDSFGLVLASWGLWRRTWLRTLLGELVAGACRLRLKFYSLASASVTASLVVSKLWNSRDIYRSRWGSWASSSKANASRKSDPYSVQSNEGRVKEFHPTRAYASRPALLRPCPCGHINSSLQPLGTHERGSDGHAWRMPWFAEVCRPWILRCRCWITLESLLEAPNTRSPLAN